MLNAKHLTNSKLNSRLEEPENVAHRDPYDLTNDRIKNLNTKSWKAVRLMHLRLFPKRHYGTLLDI